MHSNNSGDAENTLVVIKVGTPSDLSYFKIGPMDSNAQIELTMQNLAMEDFEKAYFSHICAALKTTKTVKRFKYTFESHESSRWSQLHEAIKGNTTIERLTLHFETSITTNDRDLIQLLLKSLNNRVKTVELSFHKDHVNTTSLLENIRELISPTKNFKLRVAGCYSDIETHEFMTKNIEILQTTNINKIFWDEITLFGAADPHLGGFKDFCHFLAKHDPLQSLQMCAGIDHRRSVPLTHFIKNSNKLTKLEFEISSQAPSEEIKELCDTIAKSNIRKLAMSELGNPSLCAAVADMIRNTSTLEKFDFSSYPYFSGEDPPRLYRQIVDSILQYSESIRSFKMSVSQKQQEETEYMKCQELLAKCTMRNRKLQNDRVRTIITTLFNIARDTSTTQILPRDIWTIIMSFVSIPGVSIDFGSVSRSIFNDVTIRRVIKKSKI